MNAGSSVILPFLFGLGMLITSGPAGIYAQADASKAPADRITVFITGNTLGQLRPCGCSGGQLGGFERRNAILSTAPPQSRVILDTGNFVETSGPQDMIKFDIILQALDSCKYDVVSLTGQDVETGTRLGDIEGSPLNFIAAQSDKQPSLPAQYRKTLEVAGSRIDVITRAVQADKEEVIKAAEEFKTSGPNSLKILIVNGENFPELRRLTTVGVIIVQAQDTDTPVVVEKGPPMIITAGRHGKYVGRLEARPAAGGFKLAYDAEPVTGNLAQDPTLVELYKSYQALVKEQNLLVNYPRLERADKLEYIGSKTCGRAGCHHEYNYESWLKDGGDANGLKHSSAYESLVKVGSQYDPECVICHSVGMEYKSGFTSPEMKNAEDFENVGCENCHGPGSKHLITLGKSPMPIHDASKQCINCHTSDQSANYAGHEKEYYDRQKHWKELKFHPDVKK
jgi:hypothetical protein